MPLTKDAKANIRELFHAKSGDAAWPRKRIIAAALNAARRKGGKVPPPPQGTRPPE